MELRALGRRTEMAEVVYKTLKWFIRIPISRAKVRLVTCLWELLPSERTRLEEDQESARFLGSNTLENRSHHMRKQVGLFTS